MVIPNHVDVNMAHFHVHALNFCLFEDLKASTCVTLPVSEVKGQC